MMTSTKIVAQVRKLPASALVTKNFSSAVDRASFKMPPETLELMRKLNAASSNGSYDPATGQPTYRQFPSKRKSEAYEVWHVLKPKGYNIFRRTVYYPILWAFFLIGSIAVTIEVGRNTYKYLTPPEKRLKYRYRIPSAFPYLHDVDKPGHGHGERH
uniref:Uncharacterized protein n=1 Tax=Ditylenchus dipsaci TaxID=166011 RepID=A0A915ENT7_9BILA